MVLLLLKQSPPHYSRRHLWDGDGISATISKLVFSYPFIYLHLVWFGLWIGLRVEGFPFGLLTMIVSLEAIVLTSLVGVGQERQSAVDRKRDVHESEEVHWMAGIQVQQVEMLNLIHRLVSENVDLREVVEHLDRQEKYILQLIQQINGKVNGKDI